MKNMYLALGGLSVIFIVLMVAAYVWKAVEYYKILKHLGYVNAWMAWIPYASDYAIADVIRGENGTTEVFGYDVPSAIFNFWWALSLAVSFVPGVGYVLSAIVRVVCLGTILKEIYSECENKSPVEVANIAYVSAFIPIIALVKFTRYKFRD